MKFKSTTGFLDSKRNRIQKPEDILITNDTRLAKESSIKSASISLNTKGLHGTAGRANRFGIYPAYELVDANGEREYFNVKVSAKTLEILPSHAMQDAVETKNVLVQGISYSGKSTLLSQIACESYMFAEENVFSVQNDEAAPRYNEFYSEYRHNMKKYMAGEFPLPTRIDGENEGMQRIPLYIRCKIGMDERQEAIINLIDIPGELSPKIQTPFMYNPDCIWFVISSELVGSTIQANIERLMVLRTALVDLGRCPFCVIITKCDHISGVKFPKNTIKRNGKRLELVTHSIKSGGYQQAERTAIHESAKQYLRNAAPSLANQIERLAPHAEYFFTSCTGFQDTVGNQFPPNFTPYRVDEPFLYALHSWELYPPVSGQTGWLNSIAKWLGI